MVMQRDINIRDKMIQGLCAIKAKHRNKSADEVSLSVCYKNRIYRVFERFVSNWL